MAGSSHVSAPAAGLDIGPGSLPLYRTLLTKTADPDSTHVDVPHESAQILFAQGLLWAYAFHHEEAERCFTAALNQHPHFPLAHFGIAYAKGPNYNDMRIAEDVLEEARLHLSRARALLGSAGDGNGLEIRLVDALEHRLRVDSHAAREDYAKVWLGGEESPLAHVKEKLNGTHSCNMFIDIFVNCGSRNSLG